MRFLYLLLLCSLSFGACSSGDSTNSMEASEVEIPGHLQDMENLGVLSVDAAPQYEIDLVRETNYGDRYDEAVVLGYINDFAVDDEGRVFLADMSNDRIHVYNPDGTFLQSIGRAGRGPGEFLTTRGGLKIGVNNEYLFAYDDTNYRMSRFSLETFELVDVVNITPDSWNHIEEISGSRPYRFFFREDATYLVTFSVDNYTSEELGPMSFRTGHDAYFLFDSEFELVSDNIIEVDLRDIPLKVNNGVVRRANFPFTNSNLTAFSESGNIYIAPSEEFLISIYEPNGTYIRSIYYPVAAAPFTENDREKLVEESSGLAQRFSDFGVADHWPVLNQITVDDENRLWVSIITEDYDTTEWWVLDENQELLGTFSWPRKLLNAPGREAGDYIIKNGAVYYLSTESMNLEAQTVIRYRIEMNPIGSEQ